MNVGGLCFDLSCGVMYSWGYVPLTTRPIPKNEVPFQ